LGANQCPNSRTRLGESRSDDSNIEMEDAHTEGPSQKSNFVLFRKESKLKYDLTNILPFIEH